MKVLIIDDEPKVIQLILHLIDWESFGMTIVGTAEDGSRAFTLIKELHPDIVITDIRIPSPDGLELIQKAQDEHIFPYFIIISGYNDFSYAQKAVRLGVEDYLLKPINKKDLEYVLTKVIGKHREQIRKKNTEYALSSQLEETKKIIKSKLLTDILLKDNTAVACMSPSDLALHYHCNFGGDCFLFITVHIYTPNPDLQNMQDDEYSFILSRIQDILKELLSGLSFEYLNLIYKDELLILVNTASDRQTKITDLLRSNLISLTNIYPGIRIAVGISDYFYSLTELSDHYAQSRRALANRFSNEDILLTTSKKASVNSAQTGLGPQYRKELSEAVSLLNSSAFTRAFRNIAAELHSNIEDSSYFLNCYEEIVDLIVFALKNTDCKTEIPKELLLNGFNKIYYFTDLLDWLEETSLALIDAVLAEKQDHEEKPVRLAKQYINEHFSEAITLETVSAHVGFNPAYFSTMFKKASGQNFLDYLRDIRINNAKYLLQYTDLSTSEISAKIGYTDAKYFARVFREKTRLSPQEYRKLYGSESSR